MKQRMFFVLVVVALLGACSSKSNNNAANNSADNNTNNNGADVGNNGMVDVDNTGAEYAAEYEVVFESLEFIGMPANKLNNLLAANFDLNLEYPVLVLVRLRDIDAAAGTLMIEGGSGLKTDELEVFEFDPESDPMGTAGTLDAASGEFAAEIDVFNFVSTFVYEGMANKTILNIEGLEIGGQLQLMEEGATASIVNGTLEGYMTKENGDTTLISLSPGQDPVSITQIFTEDALNFDTTTGEVVDFGDGDAWYINGTFTARPTDIAD